MSSKRFAPLLNLALAGLLALGGLLVVAPTPALGNNTPAFTDLGGYSWAEPAIETLAAQGVVKGTGPGTFDPAGQITRAQFAALMQRTFSLPQPSAPVTFTDVGTSDWDYASVEALAPYMDYYQLPYGYAFHPDDPMDRQDVATVMVKVLTASNQVTVLSASAAQSVLANVTDAGDIAPALQVYVATAVQSGLIKGFPDGSFQPLTILTRAQVAVLIQRVQNNFLTTGGGSASGSGGNGTSGGGQGTQQAMVIVSGTNVGLTMRSVPLQAGTPIIINGVNFSQGDYVYFAGAGPDQPALNVQVVSSNKITATYPATTYNLNTVTVCSSVDSYRQQKQFYAGNCSGVMLYMLP